MNGNQLLGVYEIEGKRKVEISLKRVTIWTVIFTNAFFVSYFLGRLLKWI